MYSLNLAEVQAVSGGDNLSLVVAVPSANAGDVATLLANIVNGTITTVAELTSAVSALPSVGDYSLQTVSYQTGSFFDNIQFLPAAPPVGPNGPN